MSTIRHEIPLFLYYTLVADSTDYVTRNDCIVVKYDSSNYTNPTVYLEVVAKSITTGTNDTYIHLLDIGSSVDPLASGTEVSGSEIITTSGTADNYTSGALSLTSGNNFVLQIKNESSASASGVLNGAKLIIVDTISSQPTAGIEYIPFKIAYSGVQNSSTRTTYSEMTQSGLSGTYDFTFEPDDYDGTVTYYLETHIASDNASGTAYLELYNVTESTQVAEVTYSGAYTGLGFNFRVRSSSFSLSSGKTYRFNLKVNSGSYTAYSSAVYLLVKQTGTITKTRCHTCGIGYLSIAVASPTTRFYLVDESDYWSGTTRNNYYSMRLYTGGTNTVYTDLYYSTSTITNSEVSSSASGWARVVSSNTITLPDDYYTARGWGSDTTTIKMNGGFIYTDLTFSASATTYTVTKNSDAMAVLEAYLKARYDMSTTTSTLLKDFSGYGNNGTAYGGVTIGGAVGINGNCTDFESDDYIDLGTNASITNISTNKLTLVAWAYPDSLTTYFPIFYCTQYRMSVNTSGQVEISLSLGGTVYTKTFGSAGAVATEAWSQIVFTFDGTNWDVYINKAHQTTQTQAGTLDTTSNSVLIGKKF